MCVCLGGWWQYDSRSSADLERARDDGEAEVSMLLCGSLYTINLNDMVQISQSVPTRKRNVRREHVAVQRAKGVAGLLGHRQ